MQHQYAPCPIEQLRKLIIARDYNQQELCRRTNLDQSAISNFINGGSSSPKVFSALCQHLNITLSTIHAPATLPRKRPGRPRKEA